MRDYFSLSDSSIFMWIFSIARWCFVFSSQCVSEHRCRSMYSLHNTTCSQFFSHPSLDTLHSSDLAMIDHSSSKTTHIVLANYKSSRDFVERDENLFRSFKECMWFPLNATVLKWLMFHTMSAYSLISSVCINCWRVFDYDSSKQEKDGEDEGREKKKITGVN